MGIGAQELLLILLIVLILFGAKRIPELAKGLGSGLREFRNAVKDIESNDAKSASVNESNAVQSTVTNDN
jgi:sec-independent protein translocase protein TatA